MEVSRTEGADDCVTVPRDGQAAVLGFALAHPLITFAAGAVVVLLSQQPTTRPASALLVHTDTSVPRDDQQFPLTSPSAGVKFDLNGDGVPEQTAWTAPGSKLAFLAIDRNGNGVIDNGKELFGTQTQPRAADGIHALTLSLVESGGGRKVSIFAIDPIFYKLMLWEDRNHNGVREPNELRLAKELFTEFGLGYTGHNTVDEFGNRFQRQGWLQIRTKGQDEWRIEDPEKRQRLARLMFDVVLGNATDAAAEAVIFDSGFVAGQKE